MFFPIFWMVLASFKTEAQAMRRRRSCSSMPTLENYADIFSRARLSRLRAEQRHHLLGSTVLMLCVAVPAAFAMAFYPTPRTRGTLLWMLSTKMLPAVGVLVPIYLIAEDRRAAGYAGRR